MIDAAPEMKLATNARIGSRAAARRNSATTVPKAPSSLPVRAQSPLQAVQSERGQDRADADRRHQLPIDLSSIARLTTRHERQQGEISAGEGKEGDGANERRVHFAAVANIAHAGRHCADQAFGRQRFLRSSRRPPPDQSREQRQIAGAAAPERNSDAELRDRISGDRWTDCPRDIVSGGVDRDCAVEVRRSHKQRGDEEPCGRGERAAQAHQEGRREQRDRACQSKRSGRREYDRNHDRDRLRDDQGRRGSTTSLSAPAGKVRRKSGRVVATWTADTSLGLGLRLVIIQAELVSNIASPTLEIDVAMRMTMKAGLWEACAWFARGRGRVEVQFAGQVIRPERNSALTLPARALRAFGKRIHSGRGA